MSKLTLIMNNSESAGHTQRQEQSDNTQQKQQVFFGLIDRVGSYGKYQKITILLWMSVIYFCGQLLFGVPFLFFQDPYSCDSLDPSINCKEYVCALDQSERITYLTHITIKSLAGELGDYRCGRERDKLDDLIAIMFFGIAAGYLLLTLFGEWAGKKALMLINFALFIAGIGVVLLFYGHWSAVAVGLLVAVLGISNSYIVCFMFLVETVERSVRQKATVFILSFYGLGAIVNIFWYWLFQDWHIVFFFCYLLPAAAIFVLMCIFVVDTPMSLILRNSSSFALEKLQYIAEMNGVESDITLQDIQRARLKHQKASSQGKRQIKQITVLQIFKYKSVRYLVIVLVLMQCIISFQFYAPTMMLSSFNFDIYINGLALASSQVLANFTNVFLISRFKRRFLFFACLGCILLSSLILFLLWDQNSQAQTSLLVDVAIIVLLFLFQLSISEQYSVFHVFISEVFPTQARVIAMSLISLMGGLMSTVTSKVVGECLQNNIPVMVVFMLMSGACIVITCFLPQTFKTVPRDVIAQLQQGSAVDAGSTKPLLN